MSTLQQQVVRAFLGKLEQSGALDAQKIDQLRATLATGEKCKVDELVRILSAPAGGDLR